MYWKALILRRFWIVLLKSCLQDVYPIIFIFFFLRYFLHRHLANVLLTNKNVLKTNLIILFYLIILKFTFYTITFFFRKITNLQYNQLSDSTVVDFWVFRLFLKIIDRKERKTRWVNRFNGISSKKLSI